MSKIENFSNVVDTKTEGLKLPAARLCDDCLGALSKFWLKPEVWSIAHRSEWKSPRLQGLGNCWVLVVNKVPQESVIRPAAILPLRWTKGEVNSTHDCRLPQGLCQIAESVLLALKEELKGGIWTLQSGVKDMPDISGISVGEENWQSAWVPLYAGLRLANDGLLPDMNVFATGAWKNDSLSSVTGLVQKARVAKEFGASQFFYPGNCDRKEIIQLQDEFEQSSEFLQPIKAANKPGIALADYLAALAEEPSESDSDEQFDAYYVLRPGNQKPNRDFYLKRIIGRIVKRVQEQKADLIRQNAGRTLVSWISGGNELIDVAIECFQPSRLILFKTEKYDTVKAFERIEILCQKQEPSIDLELVSFPENLPIDKLRDRVSEALQQRIKDDSVLLDLTLGKVSMSLCLYDYSRKEHSSENNCDTKVHQLYWDTKSNENNRLIPSTTTPTVW